MRRAGQGGSLSIAPRAVMAEDVERINAHLAANPDEVSSGIVVEHDLRANAWQITLRGRVYRTPPPKRAALLEQLARRAQLEPASKGAEEPGMRTVPPNQMSKAKLEECETAFRQRLAAPDDPEHGGRASARLRSDPLPARPLSAR